MFYRYFKFGFLGIDDQISLLMLFVHLLILSIKQIRCSFHLISQVRFGKFILDFHRTYHECAMLVKVLLLFERAQNTLVLYLLIQ